MNEGIINGNLLYSKNVKKISEKFDRAFSFEKCFYLFYVHKFTVTKYQLTILKFVIYTVYLRRIRSFIFLKFGKTSHTFKNHIGT
jgi:hypothetical protein